MSFGVLLHSFYTVTCTFAKLKLGGFHIVVASGYV
jgi:hypothetical protein